MEIPLIKILPQECPWCHNMPVLVKDPLWDGSHGYHGHYKYYVACRNKECNVNPHTYAYNDIYKMSEQECIEKSIEDGNT